MTTDPASQPDSGRGDDALLQLRPRLIRSARSQQRRAPVSPGSVASPGLRMLIAVRESAEHDYLLLDGMIRQTITPLLPAHPELAALVEHGAMVMRPGQQAEQLRTQLRAQDRFARSGRRRCAARVVQVSDVAVIYGLVSAGKALDVDITRNAWVDALCEVIRELRPAALVTGPFSRLVRNRDVAGRLRHCLVTTGTRIMCAEAPMGFSLSDQAGSMIWEMLVNSAHSDWISILTRMQTGALYELKQGRSPQARAFPGYTKVPAATGGRSRMVVDPAARSVVRLIIETAASGISPSEAAQILGRAGVTSRLSGNESTPLHELGEPAKAVLHLWSYLPTYLTGRYPAVLANSIPGLSEMHGELIHRADESDLGEFRFTLTYGLPGGGWHDPELIRRGIAMRLDPAPKRATGRSELRAPLAGAAAWFDAGQEYRLLPDGGTYIVRRRPATDTRRVLPGFDRYEGELLGRFSAGGLHRAVATALSRIVDGVPCDTGCLAPGETTEDLIAQAVADEGRAARFRLLAGSALDGEESRQYQRLAAEHALAGRSLRQRAADSANAWGLTSEALADAEQILATAELLRRDDIPAAEVQHALRRVVSDLRIQADPTQPLATVSLKLMVRTSAGMLRLGPVSEPVLNTAGSNRQGAAAGPRRLAEARALLVDPASGSTIRQLAGLSHRTERRRLLAVLQGVFPSRDALAAYLDCPIEELRQAVLAHVVDSPGEWQPPAGTDPRYLREVSALYGAPDFAWVGTWAAGDLTRLRQVVGWIAAYQAEPETGMSVVDLRDGVGLTDAELYRLLNDDEAKYQRGYHPLVPPLVTTKEWPPRQKMPPQERRVALAECPHCGSRTVPHLLAVPEVLDGWLCTACRRPPSADIVFPAAYLEPWVGPRQGQRRLRVGITGEQRRGEIQGSHMHRFTVPPRHAPRR